MSRIRVVLLAAFAVLAVNAVASASASAAGCLKAPETLPVYCIEESAGVFNDSFGSEEITSESLPATTFQLLVVGGPNLVCKKLTDKGTIVQNAGEDGTGDKIHLAFTECSVEGNPKCTVEDTQDKTIGTILEGPIKSKLYIKGGKVYVDVEPEVAGQPFVELNINNKGVEVCSVKQDNVAISGLECGETGKAGEMAEKALLLFSKAISTACGGTIKFGAKAFNIDGHATQLLTGKVHAAFKNNPWGVGLL